MSKEFQLEGWVACNGISYPDVTIFTNKPVFMDYEKYSYWNGYGFTLGRGILDLKAGEGPIPVDIKISRKE